MHRSLFQLFFFSIIFLFYSCSALTSPEVDYDLLKSFETEADLVNWEGLHPSMLKEDAPPNGGSKSLHIGGGCVIPTGRYVIMEISKVGFYKLSFWGKFGNGTGGGVHLTLSDSSFGEAGNIGRRCLGEEWTYYETEETLYLPPGKLLCIQILAGGIAGGSIYVDNIGIRRVN